MNVKTVSLLVVSLLIMVTIVPSITGLNLNKEKIEGESKTLDNPGFFNDYYLAVNFIKLEYDRYEKTDDVEYAIYQSEYTVKNIGEEIYFGCPTTWVNDPEYPPQWFDYWLEKRRYVYLPDSEKSFSHEIKVRASEDIEIGEERFFADHDVALKTQREDCAYFNNPSSNIQYAKYWNDKSDYVPTYSHLLVSSPWEYEIKTARIGQTKVYNIYFEDNSGLPEIINEERIGWVEELIEYFIEFTEDVSNVLELESEDEYFAISSWQNLRHLVDWMKNVSVKFEEMVNAVGDSSKLGDIFQEFKEIKENYITTLNEVSIIYFDEILGPIEEIVNDADSFQYWLSLKPWEKPILIKGKVSDVDDKEIIKLSCRGVKYSYKDEDDGKKDNITHFEFYVPSQPASIEKSYFEPHNCSIKVESSKHDNIIQTVPILQYCYSDGVVINNFDKESWSKENAHIKLIKKVSSMKYDPKIIKCLQEETLGTTSDGTIYKEYYSGAPEISGVVYYMPDELIITFTSSLAFELIENYFNLDFEFFEVIDRIPEVNSVLIDVSGSVKNLWELIVIISELLDVEFVELNTVCYACDDVPSKDPGWDKQWGHRAINCPKAWDYTKGSSDINIAFIDSGIYDHVDIKNPFKEIDFQDNTPRSDPDANDKSGHGTSVTGIVMSKWNNGEGVSGVAPGCSYSSVKVLDKEGETTKNLLAKGIWFASSILGCNADVLCVAVSEPSTNECWVLKKACDIARNKKDCIIISAAYNNDEDNLGLPATYDTTIAVGAINENLNRCDSFSPYNSKLDIVAPGENIYTTVLNDEYDYMNGTSAATAYVAGVAALYYSRRGIKNPSKADVENCEKALFQNAIDRGEKGKDKYYGHGIVDAYGTVFNGVRCVADFTWTPESPYEDKLVAFTSKSYDPDGEIKSCKWDLNNDDEVDDYGETVVCTYSNPGTYKCKLEVKSSDGQVDTVIHEIVVKKEKSFTKETLNLNDFFIQILSIFQQYKK